MPLPPTQWVTTIADASATRAVLERRRPGDPFDTEAAACIAAAAAIHITRRRRSRGNFFNAFFRAPPRLPRRAPPGHGRPVARRGREPCGAARCAQARRDLSSISPAAPAAKPCLLPSTRCRSSSIPLRDDGAWRARACPFPSHHPWRAMPEAGQRHRASTRESVIVLLLDSLLGAARDLRPGRATCSGRFGSPWATHTRWAKGCTRPWRGETHAVARRARRCARASPSSNGWAQFSPSSAAATMPTATAKKPISIRSTNPAWACFPTSRTRHPPQRRRDAAVARGARLPLAAEPLIITKSTSAASSIGA